MNRTIMFFILAVLISMDVFACTIPRSGIEYDRLIAVKELGKNKFEVSLPVVAQDLRFGTSIRVAYYKNGSEHRLPEYYKDVYANDDGSNYSAVFELVKIEGYTPYVEAYWRPEQCCTCGAYGNSHDLVLK